MYLWRTNLMKKFLLATVALVALGATVPALAADLAARPYTKAPAYAAQPIYNWTGFYIGGHLGGALAADNTLIANVAASPAAGQGGPDNKSASGWFTGSEARYPCPTNGT